MNISINDLLKLAEESECGASYTQGQGTYAEGVYAVTTKLRQMISEVENEICREDTKKAS